MANRGSVAECFDKKKSAAVSYGVSKALARKVQTRRPRVGVVTVSAGLGLSIQLSSSYKSSTHRHQPHNGEINLEDDDKLALTSGFTELHGNVPTAQLNQIPFLLLLFY